MKAGELILAGILRRERYAENVYTRGWRPGHALLHDNILADCLLIADPERFTCRDVDPTILNDADVWFKVWDDELGEHVLDKWLFELHRKDANNLKEIERERLPKLRLATDPILWIVQADSAEEEADWLDTIRSKGWDLPDLFYVTYSDLLYRTEEAILIDRDGHPARLPCD